MIQAVANDEERAQLTAWNGEIASCESQRPASPPRAYIWFEEGTEAPPTHVFDRGNPATPLAEVHPGLPAVLVDQPQAKRQLNQQRQRQHAVDVSLAPLRIAV